MLPVYFVKYISSWYGGTKTNMQGWYLASINQHGDTGYWSVEMLSYQLINWTEKDLLYFRRITSLSSSMNYVAITASK